MKQYHAETQMRRAQVLSRVATGPWEPEKMSTVAVISKSGSVNKAGGRVLVKQIFPSRYFSSPRPFTTSFYPRIIIVAFVSLERFCEGS